LALVSVLSFGDYLLWNWSLNGNHDVLALVSGLTLPPLAIAFLGLLVLSLARLISHSARRSSRRHAISRSRDQTADRARTADGARRSPRTTGRLDEDQAQASTVASGSSSSGKLAA
jgi:hypothetical protein